jgi:hypothetical protein
MMLGKVPEKFIDYGQKTHFTLPYILNVLIVMKLSGLWE